MILVALKDGECVEVETADAVRKADGYLICLDCDSNEKARFALRDVQTFTVDKQIAEEILEEACEELSVVAAAQDEKSQAS
jgi:fructose-specific phosphotransferase system component IIB